MKKSITKIIGGKSKKVGLMSMSELEDSANKLDEVSKTDIEDYVNTEIHKPIVEPERQPTELELAYGTSTVKKSEIDSYVDKTVKKGDDFLTAVNKPSHYQGIVITGKNGSMEFEAIEIIDSVLDQLNLPPAVSHAVGDALKYQLRCGKKESDNNTTTDLLNKAAQDLRKGGWYLTRGSDLLLAFAKKEV